MARDHKERWDIKKELPAGGQANVYIVTDKTRQLDGLFVLKRLKNPCRLDRFVDEVRALHELDHEGITKLIDFDLDDKRPWFVQEYCEGGDLEDFVEKRKPIEPGKCFDFLIQISDALAYAHSKSRVHRDIKPANIFLRSSDGPAVLGDFGLTFGGQAGSERITLTDEQVGSRFYMAPELADGRLENLTWKCDIYSLGKVLYFMLTGGRKFDRENYSDEINDVVGITGNVYLEHANNLFKKMITLDPETRATAEMISNVAKQLKRLVEEGYPPLSGRHLSPCNYCGVGMYEPVASNLQEYMASLGFSGSGITDQAKNLRVMACRRCGHIQVFHMGKASRQWWPVPRSPQ